MAAAGISEMKVAAETLYLRKHFGEKGAIRILAEAGFDCIDFTMDYMVHDDCPLNAPNYREFAEELRRYGESLGVRFSQAHAPFEFDWDRPGIMDTVLERTIRCLEIASIMGIDTVIVHPLHYKNYFHRFEEVWSDNVRFFTELLPYAQKYDVRMCLENLFEFDPRGIIVPDTCADVGRYIKALDLFDDPHLAACVDVGHACLVGENPADLIRGLGHERLHALHIHDNNRVIDEHTLPYLGKIDWEDLTKALAEIDYSDVFNLETMMFYTKFPVEFAPTAARWLCDMARYLARKVEDYKAELRG